MEFMNFIPLPRVRLHPTSLLDMPLEIQLQIFKYTLSDPILWERRHRPGCDLCPTEVGVMEQPPFMWHRPIVHAVYRQGKRKRQNRNKNPDPNYDDTPDRFSLAETWTFCDCGKRAGIGLLRTNRHIFSIAAPIFWSQGDFCFFDATEFAACISITSTGTRSLIRGVNISYMKNLYCPLDMRVCLQSKTDKGEDYDGGPLVWATKCLPAFWEALPLLKRLEHLSLPPSYLDEAAFRNLSVSEHKVLRPCLHRLRALDLAEMFSFGGTEDGTFCAYSGGQENFWKLLFKKTSVTSICSYSERVPLWEWLHYGPKALPETLHRLQNHTRSRFRSALLWGVQKQMVYRSRSLDTGELIGWRAPTDLVGGIMTIPMNGGDNYYYDGDFTLYNLPWDKETCDKNKFALSRRRDEEKAMGGDGRYDARQRKITRREQIRKFVSMRSDEHSIRLNNISPTRPAANIRRDPPAGMLEIQPKRQRAKKGRRGYKAKKGEWEV